MGEATAIAWTTHTFNPIWGCVEVSPACDHCYARDFAARVGHGKRLPQIWGPAANTERRTFGDKHWNDLVKWDRNARAAGERRRVFVGSMCDWAEDHAVTRNEVDRLWPLVEFCPSLDFLLLTKRPKNIRKVLPARWLENPRPNVWLGTTCEDQRRVDERLPMLLDVPARVHFVSAEPLLEPITLRSMRPAWVIVGGESGPHARPFNLLWARDLRAQCLVAGSAFFMKQFGDNHWDGATRHHRSPDGGKWAHHGADPAQWPTDLRVQDFPA